MTLHAALLVHMQQLNPDYYDDEKIVILRHANSCTEYRKTAEFGSNASTD